MDSLRNLFLGAVMFALLPDAIAESRSVTEGARSPAAMVGVSLQIVDACGVASQAAGVLLRCRSTAARAAGSVSRLSPALVSTQWCRSEGPAASSAQEFVCSEVRTPGSDQQLIVFTF
jgi:hypothetical protein